MKPVRLFEALFAVALLIHATQLASAQICRDKAAGQNVVCDCQACSTDCQTENAICVCGHCKRGCFDKCPRPLRRVLGRCNCPDCGYLFNPVQEYCDFNVTESMEERTCFQTEQKTVCIPPLTFPWQKCGPARCAKTRSVTVLKTHTYKCPVCKYSWEVKKLEPATAAEKVEAVAPPTAIVKFVPENQPVNSR